MFDNPFNLFFEIFIESCIFYVYKYQNKNKNELFLVKNKYKMF